MALRPKLVEDVERRLLRRVDQHVCAELVAGQVAPLGLEVGHDDRLDAPTGERGDRGQADGARSDHDRNLARLNVGRPHVELPHREGVGQRRRIERDAILDLLGQHLGDDEQLAEAALRLGVLPDDPRAVDAAVEQSDRDGGDAGADRELVGATGAMADHLGDELVPEHDVAVVVVERPSGGIVDGERRVVHEVHVRGADRRAERPAQQLSGTGHGIGGLADRQLTVSQHHCAHVAVASLEYSRYLLENTRRTLETEAGRVNMRDAASPPTARAVDVVEFVARCTEAAVVLGGGARTRPQSGDRPRDPADVG